LTEVPTSVDELAALLARHDYLAAPSLATTLFLGIRLGKPTLLEGEAGVGKTEVAKTLAVALGRRLIRLQCYEGLDATTALYEWDFLSPDPAGPPVLLIDELDRTDEPFEAFLLEILSDFQVTIPELGTIRAAAQPIVIITSNRTREIHDAIKRRCLYHWIDYPTAERELAILAARAPDVPLRLAAQIVAFVQALRASDLFKLPGVAETLDWAHALVALGAVELDPATVEATLGVLLKYQDDLARITGPTAQALVAAARAG
jgi:MoxR-like ATPase